MTRYDPLCKGTGIKVDYDLKENLALVPIDEEGIINALNIVVENGIEAMSTSPLSSPIKGEEIRRGGILKLRTSMAQKMEKEVTNEFVVIEICDTGKGIPEKYLNKVFDPYFTYDKPFGTGLGLTLAKKLVDSHKGFIEITSKEGFGTTISIYLPTQ
jgi:signal transduction histidine kinase